MDAHDGRHAVHHAGRDHGLRASLPLFGRLEQETHGARPAPPGQRPRGRGAHRDVAVVAAGVHRSLDRRGVGGARRFRDRQRVHVDPKEQRGAVLSPGFGEQAGPAESGAQRQAASLEERRDAGGRAPLAPGQLGMAVEVAAEGDDLVAQGRDLRGEPGHGRSLTGCAAYNR